MTGRVDLVQISRERYQVSRLLDVGHINIKIFIHIIYIFQPKKGRGKEERRKSVLIVEDLGSCDDEDSDDEKEKEMVEDESD